MSLQAEKLATAFEQEHEVRIGSDTFTVRPFGMRQLTGSVIEHLQRVLAVCEAVDQMKAKGESISDLELFQYCGETAYALLGLAIKQPVEYFDTANPVDTLKAFALVVELNIPFFGNALGSELPKTLERIEKAVAKLKKQASQKA
ncbi:hypothetical protein [Burkholderia pseudomallei]|uniref:hypothetical protein n=1 Tax=Burkholderia pseudomallei TaxID=28450 RepID=UPI00097686E9|nr:hypothetical protein [Burkholderia pseudomallei]OMS07798.1 hypothetical protein AQ736_03355 [Burkholderia pseudomallei]OMS96426.1 hypothetical protein AQ750_04635 [Burkholderia pseudomallei]OMV27166.1 hypothetical protein AQ787_14180 [Burkholderia pseudomallei]CAJ3486656.1 Uncharacterised protein [Burkholderia pseudomallei]CAJ4176184.1 Uncharacterised protein [Burkholderia pseudomallei]